METIVYFDTLEMPGYESEPSFKTWVISTNGSSYLEIPSRGSIRQYGPNGGFEGLSLENQDQRQCQLWVDEISGLLNMCFTSAGLKRHHPMAIVPPEMRREPHFRAWIEGANIALGSGPAASPWRHFAL